MAEDLEKQKLIDVHLEPVRWVSSADETHSDSDFSQDDFSVDVQWSSDGICPDLKETQGTERDQRRSAGRKLIVACAVSLVFMTGEVIEIVAMLLSVGSIWAVTAVLVFTAAQRLTDGDYDIDTPIMLLTSGCAVAVNVLMVLILHQSGAPHGHSHGSSRPQRDKHKGLHHGHSNASVRAAFVHVVGDLLQSVGVLLAATVIHFRPEFKAADPICTFLFSVLVLWTTVPIIKDVFRILMEGCPQHIDVEKVKELLLSVSGVVSVHSLRVWSLNMTQTLLTAHVLTEEDTDSKLVLMKATNLLHSEFSFSNVTIQVEQLSSGSRTLSTQ